MAPPNVPINAFKVGHLPTNFQCHPASDRCHTLLHAHQIENLGLCNEIVTALRKRGIKALFPIQSMVFAPAREGRDLIGRAKTGSGKTLAFALPVIEALLEDARAAGGVRRRPGPPKCIVLAPTRELANQVGVMG